MHGLSASLWRLWRGTRNGVIHLVVRQPLRGLSMLVVLSVVWLLLSGLFWAMLRFLEQDQYVGFKERLLETLLGVFFFALFFLVSISDVVVVWSGLFRSRAAVYQAQTPIDDRALFWTAAIEGGAWSSWAVLVLALPLVGTIAPEAVQPGWFVPAALIALASFVLCCLAIGALGALALARIIPLLRRGIKGIVAIVIAILAISTFLLLGSANPGNHPASFVQQVVGKLGFTENPLLPSAWTQQALMAARAARWSDWLHHILLLLSTATAIAIIGEMIAGRRLRRELDLLTGRPEQRVGAHGGGKAWRLLPFLPADIGLLAAKDIRLFTRDPAQILQFTMFFGLLGFYLLLLPRLGRAFLHDEAWRPAVSLLNLTAIAMALATFTGRFVYPLLSLEGRRLWVLILAPFPRQRVVTAKFTFAVVIGTPVSMALVGLSGVMLELPLHVVLYQVGVIACMACGLSAGALGVGARFADYGEDNPGKLVAGYGGNVNLLLSLIFTGLLVAGAAVPLVVRAPWAWLAGGAWTMVVSALWTWTWLAVAWRWFARA